MPKRTTVITVRIAPDKAVLDDLVKAAENAGAQKPVVVEVWRRRLWHRPRNFRRLRCCDTIRTLCPRERRHDLAATHSRSCAFLGRRIRARDNAKRSTLCPNLAIRRKHHSNYATRQSWRLDLGPSTFGNDKAGDAAIADVVDIVPARPGEV